MKELEEHLELIHIDIQDDEQHYTSIQEAIFQVLHTEQPCILSLFQVPLIHVIPTRYTYKERVKIYHSLFPHNYPLNS